MYTIYLNKKIILSKRISNYILQIKLIPKKNIFNNFYKKHSFIYLSGGLRNTSSPRENEAVRTEMWNTKNCRKVILTILRAS